MLCCDLQWFIIDVVMSLMSLWLHICQPLSGVNLSPEFVHLYFPSAGWGLLFFHWQQQHFELQPACVAVEGRSSVVLKMQAQLQISLSLRFFSLLHWASPCVFGDGVCWLLIQQFFSLFAQFKTATKSHENYVSLDQLFYMAIFPPLSIRNFLFYTGKLYGLTGMWLYWCLLLMIDVFMLWCYCNVCFIGAFKL